MRDMLRETPCRDCHHAPVRGCIGGMFPSWIVEVRNGVEYRYAVQCPQLTAHQATQQHTTQVRPPTRRRR
jgi:hypothetical protein